MKMAEQEIEEGVSELVSSTSRGLYVSDRMMAEQENEEVVAGVAYWMKLEAEWALTRQRGSSQESIVEVSTVSEEEITRWIKLGKLGTEATLRELGFPEYWIIRITEESTAIAAIDVDYYARYLENFDGVSLLLAVIGRGVSPLTTLMLSSVGMENFVLVEKQRRALFVNLKGNSNLRHLDLSGHLANGTEESCFFLGHALRTNSALKELLLSDTGLSSASVKYLVDGLESNTTLEYLSIHSNDQIMDEGVGHVARMLSKNTGLKTLDMYETGCEYLGAELMMSGLAFNSTLEDLRFGPNPIGRGIHGRNGMSMLLSPLMGGEDDSTSDQPKNTTLRYLGLREMKSWDLSVKSLAAMILSNKTLLTLDLSRAELTDADMVHEIIPALKMNNFLQHLDLTGCSLTVRVYEEIEDVITSPQSNTGLEAITVDGNDFSDKHGVIAEELRVNKEYRGRLREQRKVSPTSGRVVLCGYQFAGKSTVCKTMVYTMDGIPPANNWKTSGKHLMVKFPRFRKFLFGKQVFKEFGERTRGFDVVLMRNKEPYRISAWDFAGQKEYYALHDYMFPNVTNSCFLYVCSPRFPPTEKNALGDIKGKEKMWEEFLYWMRFIASNSKSTRRNSLPSVTFVLTNKDNLDKNRLGILRLGQKRSCLI